MSQVPAVSCIQLPVLEMIEAIRRSRKTGRRKGSQANRVLGACAFSDMVTYKETGHMAPFCHDKSFPATTTQISAVPLPDPVSPQSMEVRHSLAIGRRGGIDG